MPNDKSHSNIVLLLWLLIFICLPFLGFEDLLGLLISAMLSGILIPYAIIGIAIILALIISRFSSLSLSVLALYILIPLCLVITVNTSRGIKNKKVIELEKEAHKTNVESFSLYCSDRRQKIYRKVSVPKNSSLFIKIDDNFKSIASEFSASHLAYKAINYDKCYLLGFKYFEDDFNYKHSTSSNSRFIKYEICSRNNTSGSAVKHVSAKYELVIGESSAKQTTPKPYSSEFMSRNSIRIIEKSSGEVLAEDTIYFLVYKTGGNGCPDGYEQIYDLIQKVFCSTCGEISTTKTKHTLNQLGLSGAVLNSTVCMLSPEI